MMLPLCAPTGAVLGHSTCAIFRTSWSLLGRGGCCHAGHIIINNVQISTSTEEAFIYDPSPINKVNPQDLGMKFECECGRPWPMNG